MSSSSAAPSTPRPASVQSDRADNLQYPLSDSDSSLIEHPSTSIMESDTGSEDGMSYLSDSTYEIISQSSFQASDSEDEDDSPATPQDTDDDSIVNFGTVTPSETSRDEEPDTIPQPPDPREESFEEQRLRAETEAEAERDEAIIYTPEELEIDEQLSTPSLNTSTIRGSTITTAGASQSIEDWINFKEPIASVADGLLNVTNEKKQNVASNKIEDSTSRIAHEINETVHNAIEACINLFNMVSRYAQAHIIEPSRQKLPSRDTLAALLPEDPRVTVPSLWAIAAFLATPILINCLVGLAQYSRSGTRITPAVGMAVTSTCLSNATCLQELDAMKAVFIGLKSSQAKVAMIQDILAGKSKSPARSESGLSVYEPTTKPRTGWFGKAKAEPAPERRQEWNIVSWQRKGPIQGPIVLQKTSSLVDQFQVNVSSSQLSRTILFNPQDNATHYPADEAATMRSKIVRVNATAIELHMPSAWPCGNFSVTIKPYPPSSLRIITTQFVFVVEDCKPAFSWKDFDLNNWLVASFAQSSQPDVISGFSSRLWEDFQALLSRHGLSRPTGSAVNAGPTTSDGTCGIAHGGTVCGNWSGGSCCSKDGTCGNSSSHCGAGCQSGCKSSLTSVPPFPKLPKLPQFDIKKLPTPREMSQILRDDLKQTRKELRLRADLFREKLKEMNLRMAKHSAKTREERSLRREMKRAKALHKKLHKASEPGIPSLPVKKARSRALKLRDRADAALKNLLFRFQRWEARIGREYRA